MSAVKAEKEQAELLSPKQLSFVKGDKQERVDPSSDGWRYTMIWVMSVLSWYLLFQRAILPNLMATNPQAREKLLEQVPVRAYEYSEAAFFTAMVLNLLSFVFEETPAKRQLALLSALIKGLSWHCDTLIVGNNAVITFDAHGALLLPSRYVQWSCTTPTMLFTLSKISNLSTFEVTSAILVDVLMVATGWIAAECPVGAAFWVFTVVSFVSFVYTLHMMHRMISSARSEATENEHAKACLNFTWDSSLLIWSLFPVGWVLARTGIPHLAIWAEPIHLFSNFAAKVVFSSCILYNNFVTIAQRRLMAQLEQEHKDRIIMVESLKETVQSKDEFISVIGHELRTPLNAVIQLSNAVARGAGGKLSDRAQLWMETISSSATHLLGIINDIISVKANRTLQVKQDLVKIGPIVDKVLRVLAPMAKRGVMLQKIMGDNLPPMVGDERRLVQALSNIIGNALKFTDKGTVTVRVSTDEKGHNIVMKVSDSGCGIPKEKIGTLFKPFRQADMSSKRKYGGTGLGLSIAKQLLEAHQGTICAESAVGVGTTITMTIPVLQRSTRASLEKSFKTAYVGAGFDMDNLLAPPVEKGAFRPSFDMIDENQASNASSKMPRRNSRSPSVASNAPSSVTSQTRSSIDMSTAVVEQYRWSEEFGDHEPQDFADSQAPMGTLTEEDYKE
eukprot:gene4427-14559_t